MPHNSTLNIDYGLFKFLIVDMEKILEDSLVTEECLYQLESPLLFKDGVLESK